MSGEPRTVWRWLAPALLLLALLLALAGLPRGIDLTDESFYWLHFRHWQQFNFQVTFFGAYLDLPFRLLGESASLMRGLGLLLVLGSGALFLRAAQQHLQGAGPALLMGAALALTHYNFFWTLRSPSYNTLVLASMLLSSGLLLAWLRSPAGRRRDALALAYGLLIGVCLFSKATSAAALVLLHALLLIAEWRSWSFMALLRAAAAALLGFGLNLLYIHVRQPEWFAALRNGLEFARTIETRDALLSLRGLYWHWAQAALPLAGVLLALLGLLAAAWRGGERLRNAALLLLVALPAALLCTLDRGRVLWWPATALATVGVWLLAWRAGAPRAGSLGLLLFALLAPFAYSIGTNLGLSMHTQLIAVLPLGLLWLGLQQLQQRGQLGARSFALASALLVLPGLAAQAWPWLSQQATYRQATSQAQADQALPSDSPLAGLRGDATTVAAIELFRARLHAAGFRAGQPLLDFSGANPGLVHAAAGRPLGLAWLLGSYPGSREAAALLLSRQAPAALRQAWLIVSPDAKRRIAEPTRLLVERLGEECHRAVDRFVLDLPAADGIGLPPAPITVELWQPVCAP